MNSENQAKAIHTEKKFQAWLDQNKIPYWYIQQNFETFSPALKTYFQGKRPDYMILLPHLGFILVDVKYKKVGKIHNDFMLDCEETIQYSSLQRNFGLEVWYACSNEESDFKTWYWIPTSRVLEKGKGKQYTSSTSQKDFFAIKLIDFVQIAHNDSLDRLFSKLLLQ